MPLTETQISAMNDMFNKTKSANRIEANQARTAFYTSVYNNWPDVFSTLQSALNQPSTIITETE